MPASWPKNEGSEDIRMAANGKAGVGHYIDVHPGNMYVRWRAMWRAKGYRNAPCAMVSAVVPIHLAENLFQKHDRKQRAQGSDLGAPL